MSKKEGKAKSKSFEFNKKSITLLILLSLAGILTGFFVGSFFMMPKEVDYSQFNKAKLEDDLKAISLSAEGKSPKDFEGYEIFEIAEYRAFQHGAFTVVGDGEVDTVANQKILSFKAFENGTYFKENISKGLKKVGERTYYKKGENVICHKASKVADDMTASYKPSRKYTYEEYSAINGVAADDFVPYIVSSKTLLKSEEDSNKLGFDDKVSKIKLDNGKNGYKFILRLDPILSVLNYVHQMDNLSGTGLPTFDMIQLTVVVDEDFRFISMDTYETYTVVYMGVAAGCTGTLNEKFDYGKENIIPETNI